MNASIPSIDGLMAIGEVAGAHRAGRLCNADRRDRGPDLDCGAGKLSISRAGQHPAGSCRFEARRYT